MREKGGSRIFCVTCELYVVRESDLTSDEKQRHGVASATSSPARPAASTVTAAAARKAPSESTLAELEAGLASLSAHNMYDQIKSDLRAENGDDEDDDGENDEEDEEDAYVNVESMPNKTALAAKANLDDYARSQEARRAAAAADEADEYGSRDTGVPSSQVDAHMKRLDNLSAKLGAKMLAGWTLLGDSCPREECACPLMKERGATTMLCVNCDSIIVKDGEELRIVQDGGKVPIGTNKAVESASTTATRPVTKVVQKSSIRGSRRGRRNEDESDDEEEDEEDLAFDEGADTILSPSETATVSFDAADPYSLANLPADLSDPTPQRSTVNSTNHRSSSMSSDQVSAKLGEKMLQGYALLAVHCPREECNCPLVRKRDGPMMCVKCGSTIVDEKEYDEEVHGPAENAKPTQTPAATSKATPTRAHAQAGNTGATPVKRHASPSLNELRDEENQHKHTKRVDSIVVPSSASSTRSPRFDSFVSSPLIRGDSLGGASSTTSSGLPSPSAGNANGRTNWNFDYDAAAAAEAAVDPRLRQQAQLGGKSGRFNAPHSRANSLAVGATQVQAHHMSGAALNAAAHMAFGSPSSLLKFPRSSSSNSLVARSSGPSSVEQSPQFATLSPPSTPLNQPTPFALGAATQHLHHHTVRHPQSRHPSINYGAGASLVPHNTPIAATFIGTNSRGSIIQQQSQHQQLFSEPLSRSPHKAHVPSPMHHSVRFVNDSIPELTMTAAITGSASASASNSTDGSFALSASPLSYSAVRDSTLLGLISKLDSCRARLVDADDAQTREIAATMRELIITIDFLNQHQP